MLGLEMEISGGDIWKRYIEIYLGVREPRTSSLLVGSGRRRWKRRLMRSTWAEVKISEALLPFLLCSAPMVGGGGGGDTCRGW